MYKTLKATYVTPEETLFDFRFGAENLIETIKEGLKHTLLHNAGLPILYFIDYKVRYETETDSEGYPRKLVKVTAIPSRSASHHKDT